MWFCLTASSTRYTSTPTFSSFAPQHLRLRSNPSSAPASAAVTDPHDESELREDDALPLLPIGGQGQRRALTDRGAGRPTFVPTPSSCDLQWMCAAQSLAGHSHTRCVLLMLTINHCSNEGVGGGGGGDGRDSATSLQLTEESVDEGEQNKILQTFQRTVELM